MATYDKYSAEEDQFIEDNLELSCLETARKCLEKFGTRRTVGAIQARRKKYGWDIGETGGTTIEQHEWNAAIASALESTPGSYTRPDKWSKEEFNILKTYASEGYDVLMEKLPKRSRKAIYAQAKNRGYVIGSDESEDSSSTITISKIEKMFLEDEDNAHLSNAELINYMNEKYEGSWTANRLTQFYRYRHLLKEDFGGRTWTIEIPQ